MTGSVVVVQIRGGSQTGQSCPEVWGRDILILLKECYDPANCLVEEQHFHGLLLEGNASMAEVMHARLWASVGHGMVPRYLLKQ